MPVYVRLIILIFLCTFLFHSCNNALYNPFIKDTYRGDREDTETPGPTGEPTSGPTSGPTSEPTPGGSNETPEAAEPITLVGGTAMVSSDSSDVSQAVDLSMDSCVGGSTGGNDLFYSIDLAEGDTITIAVTPTSEWDPAIYLFTDSADPEGSCVAGADDKMSGDAETIMYTVPAGAEGTYIIGIDCFFSIATCGGPFDMDIEVY
jgi:hypothetical protein